jgi:hypothetical protein
MPSRRQLWEIIRRFKRRGHRPADALHGRAERLRSRRDHGSRQGHRTRHAGG